MKTSLFYINLIKTRQKTNWFKATLIYFHQKWWFYKISKEVRRHAIRMRKMSPEKLKELSELADKLINEGKNETITDGYAIVSAWCPKCKQKTMSVVRPGKFQCDNCR